MRPEIRALFLLLSLNAAGCFGGAPQTGEGESPATLQTKAKVAEAATYSSAQGEVAVEVTGLRENLDFTGALQPTVEVKVVQAGKQGVMEERLAVSTDGGRLIGWTTVAPNGVEIYRTAENAWESARREVLVLGLQASLQGQMLNLSFLNDSYTAYGSPPHLEVQESFLTLELPGETISESKRTFSATFGDQGALPQEVEGSRWGHLTSVSHVPGTTPLISQESAQSETTDLRGVAWTGPLPPESPSSLLEFSLREAYDRLLQESPDVRAYAAEFPGHRLCQGMYSIQRPLVPPFSEVWFLELCESNGARVVGLVRRNHYPDATLDPTFDVSGVRRRSGDPVVPSQYLPGSLVPVDHLYDRLTELYFDNVENGDWGFAFMSHEWNYRQDFLKSDGAVFRDIVKVSATLPGKVISLSAANGHLLSEQSANS